MSLIDAAAFTPALKVNIVAAIIAAVSKLPISFLHFINLLMAIPFVY